MSQLDPKEIWDKVVSLIRKNNLTITPRNINEKLFSLIIDKRRNLEKHKVFLNYVAERCLKDKIKSYAKFKTLF